jgi:chromosome partitioning protein
MIISTSLQKGGVGKTVTTVMLAQYFAFVRNYKVLIIDMDPQGNCTSSFLEKDGLSLKQVMIDKLPFDGVVKNTFVPNLDIVVSDIDLTILELHLLQSGDGAYFLRDLIDYKRLTQKYDIILIDTPPNLGRLTQSSLMASDFVLIPLPAKTYATDGLSNLLVTIEELRSKPRLNPNLKILGAFINMYEERTKVSKGILDQIRAQVPDILMRTHVRFNIRVEECVSQRELLYTYDPKSNAALDFTSLGEEALERAVVNGVLMPEAAA